MYNLLISPKAGRRLKTLKIEHQRAVLEALTEISEDPFVGKPLTRELTGRFSYKIGIFRIIYKINESNKTVRIITAGHRSTVYN